MSYKVCRMAVYAGTALSEATTLVGFTSGARITENGEEIDVSVTGACVKSYLTGPVETQITLDGFSRHLPSTDAESTQDAGQALIVPGARISLKVQPDGVGTGKPQARWDDVTVNSRDFAGVNDGAWTWNVVIRSNVATDDTAQT